MTKPVRERCKSTGCVDDTIAKALIPLPICPHSRLPQQSAHMVRCEAPAPRLVAAKHGKDASGIAACGRSAGVDLRRVVTLSEMGRSTQVGLFVRPPVGRHAEIGPPAALCGKPTRSLRREGNG